MSERTKMLTSLVVGTSLPVAILPLIFTNVNCVVVLLVLGLVNVVLYFFAKITEIDLYDMLWVYVVVGFILGMIAKRDWIVGGVGSASFMMMWWLNQIFSI